MNNYTTLLNNYREYIKYMVDISFEALEFEFGVLSGDVADDEIVFPPDSEIVFPPDSEIECPYSDPDDIDKHCTPAMFLNSAYGVYLSEIIKLYRYAETSEHRRLITRLEGLLTRTHLYAQTVIDQLDIPEDVLDEMRS